MNNYSRVYAEVNIDTLRENILKIKKYINNKKFLAVVKADAYGHGAAICARNIDDLIDFYGVATLDEALDLKTVFVTKPILVLGAIFDERIFEAIDSEVRLTVFSIDMAKKLSEYATLMRKKCYIHIKIDTGMSRLGFLPNEDLITNILSIKKLPNIELEGIFTHLANADEEDETKAINQISKFNELIEKLKLVGLDVPIIHCANSAGINCFPTAIYDMVRAGIIMYGYYPSEEISKNIDVKPAISLKSHITSVKEIPKDTGVSYNSTFITKTTTKVAVVPVGYADGYPRTLSNIGYVLVNGKRANVLGRVCMDQFVIDVSDIEVKTNDKVTLIGKDGKEEISLLELSNLSGRFPYEFICCLSKRIPRLYFKNNTLIDEINYFYTSRRI